MVSNYRSDTLHHNRLGANTDLTTIHRPSRCRTSSFISERIIFPIAALTIILNMQLKKMLINLWNPHSQRTLNQNVYFPFLHLGWLQKAATIAVTSRLWVKRPQNKVQNLTFPVKNSTGGYTLPQNINKPNFSHSHNLHLAVYVIKPSYNAPGFPTSLRPGRNDCFVSDLKHIVLWPSCSWDFMSSHRNTDCRGRGEGKKGDKTGNAEETLWFCN